MAFYYTGTDPNPPQGAVAQPMSADNLAPALHAWLLLTTNPSWLDFFETATAPPDIDLGTVAAKLGITLGCLKFILNFAQNKNSVAAMRIVCNQFQAINHANAVNPYDFPCPYFADLEKYL
jgi:hypothetical protein